MCLCPVDLIKQDMNIVCLSFSFFYNVLIMEFHFFSYSVNLDDCWQVSRDANGTIQPDPVAFPNGIRTLADYMHTRKLKLGLYSGSVQWR